MAVLGTLEYLISIDSSKLNSGISGAESKVKGFGNRLSSWTMAKGQLIARFAERAISSLSNIMKSAVNDSMAFDKSMSQVAATMGKTVDEMNQEIGNTTVEFFENGKTVAKEFEGNLSDFARFMGENTAFTAEEASQALNYMALAGYDTKKSMRMLPQVLNLAAAGNFDLARASDMVTDAQSALGLEIEDTEKLVDQMAKTASKSNTSVEQLGDAMLTVGGTAKMMKGGTAEVSTVLGILADNGVKGSEGGTALRNVLLSLSAPTDKASAAIDRLGLKVFDAQGNMRSMEDIMLDLNKAMDGMTQEERTNILNDIFNKRDLKSVEALLGTTKDRWEELTSAIGDSKGSAAAMAGTQLDNLAGDVTKFNSALGEAKITLVEGLTPSLRRFVQLGTKLVQRLTKAFKEKGLKGALQEVGKITGKFFDNLKQSENPVLRTLGNIAKGFWDIFHDADGSFRLPTLEEFWSKLQPALSSLWEGVKGLAKKILIFAFGEDENGGIKWPSAAELFAKVGEGLRALWAGLQTLATDILKFVFGEDENGGIDWPSAGEIEEKIRTGLTALWDQIKGIGSDILKFVFGEGEDGGIDFTTDTEGIKEKVKKGLDTLWQGVKTVASGILKFLFGEDADGGITWPSVDEFKEKVVAGFTKLWDVAGAAITAIADWVLGKMGLPDVETIKTQFANWWENKAKPAIKKVANWLLGQLGLPDVDTIVSYIQTWWDTQVKPRLNLSVIFGLHPAKVQETGGKIAAGEYEDLDEEELNEYAEYLNDWHRQAKGNWMVPYDNYPSLLHRGEMVLSKSQARQFRDGGYGSGIGTDIGREIREAMGKINVLMSGEKVGDLTTKRVKRNINANNYSRLRAMGG